MSLDNFIPSVWAGTMLRFLDTKLVFAQPGVVNRDYEGEIAGLGDTVKINQVGPVTIGAYTKNTNISAAETLTDAQTALVIDTAKYFNFQVDDIDQAQQNPKVMQTAMSRAAYAMANTIDAAIATVMSAGVASGNILTPVTSFTATTGVEAYLALVNLSVALDEANAPEDGRFCIVPPWFHGLLLLDSRFVNATDMGNQIRMNGQVGEAAGFSIMKSNNLVQPSAGTTYDVLAGVNWAMSYASQVVEVEAYRPELRFADAVKGLDIYGMKVVLPDALAKVVCTK